MLCSGRQWEITSLLRPLCCETASISIATYPSLKIITLLQPPSSKTGLCGEQFGSTSDLHIIPNLCFRVVHGPWWIHLVRGERRGGGGRCRQCSSRALVHSAVDSGLLCDLLLSTVQWIQVCFVTWVVHGSVDSGLLCDLSCPRFSGFRSALWLAIVHSSVDSGLLCDLELSKIQWIQVSWDLVLSWIQRIQVCFVTWYCIASVLPCTNSLLGVMILASPNGYKNNVYANCKKYIVSWNFILCLLIFKITCCLRVYNYTYFSGLLSKQRTPLIRQRFLFAFFTSLFFASAAERVPISQLPGSCLQGPRDAPLRQAPQPPCHHGQRISVLYHRCHLLWERRIKGFDRVGKWWGCFCGCQNILSELLGRVYEW